MVNSLLDDVNKLLRSVYGDKGRLEDIKERLEKGRTLYNSDNNYLEKLMDEHDNKIQKITESKNNEPESEPESEPEPYEQYQPKPEHEPKSNPKPKKKSSKKTKPLTIFLILAMLVSLAILGYAIGNYTTESTPTVTNEQPKVTIPKVKSFSQMNDSELEKISIDWNYRDVLRNVDDYSGKIIFVDGKVTNIQRDVGSINLCTSGYTSYSVFTCDEFMFVNVNGVTTWLEDDKLSGFVEVKRLSETGSNNVFTKGEWVGSGEYVPTVNEIRLTCSNC
jgi:hypothetical protein